MTDDTRNKLLELGWSAFFENALSGFANENGFPARVISSGRKVVRVQPEPDIVMLGEASGRLAHIAESQLGFPAVGDWVLCESAGENRVIIKEIFPRKSVLVRKAAGSTFEEQVLATNVDTVFIVTSMNQDFNVARLERYLAMVQMSGAQPVIVLSKSDLTDDPQSFVDEAEKLGRDLLVFAISSKSGEGVDQLKTFLTPGSTSVLLGSSGVGKSTLVNKLFGKNITETQEIREDDAKGRHTTTERNLWRSSEGAMIIDTPGMRELQLWDDGSGVDAMFSDIEKLALECRFTNCQHKTEPGCAIKEAIDSGELEQSRYDRYLKLQKEIAFQLKKSQKNKFKR